MAARVTILDDYQRVALTSADWSAVGVDHELDVLSEHIDDIDELVDRLAASEVIVAMRERTPFPASVLARLPRLRLLITTGPVNAAIDVAAAHEHGITVCGTRIGGSSTPELTIGLMIALSRHFVEEDRSMRAGGWQHTIGPGLAGSTLGLVGLGRLGKRVATIAQALDMNVVAWSPHLTAERTVGTGVTAVSKAQLFAESGFVSVHMVLSAATRGLIGPAELALMRPSAYLINTSRGPLVDEAALMAALTECRIGGAGLDVYNTEPLPADHPLRRLPNTLLLPHIGFVTHQAYEVFYGDAVADILAFRAGAPVRELSARKPG